MKKLLEGMLVLALIELAKDESREPGLCSIARIYIMNNQDLEFFQAITTSGYLRFRELVMTYISGTSQEVFYDIDNEEVEDENQFIFKPYDWAPRVKWLKAEIARL